MRKKWDEFKLIILLFSACVALTIFIPDGSSGSVVGIAKRIEGVPSDVIWALNAKEVEVMEDGDLVEGDVYLADLVVKPMSDDITSDTVNSVIDSNIVAAKLICGESYLVEFSIVNPTSEPLTVDWEFTFDSVSHNDQVEFTVCLSRDGKTIEEQNLVLPTDGVASLYGVAGVNGVLADADVPFTLWRNSFAGQFDRMLDMLHDNVSLDKSGMSQTWTVMPERYAPATVYVQGFRVWGDAELAEMLGGRRDNAFTAQTIGPFENENSDIGNIGDYVQVKQLLNQVRAGNLSETEQFVKYENNYLFVSSVHVPAWASSEGKDCTICLNLHTISDSLGEQESLCLSSWLTNYGDYMSETANFEDLTLKLGDGEIIKTLPRQAIVECWAIVGDDLVRLSRVDVLPGTYVRYDGERALHTENNLWQSALEPDMDHELFFVWDLQCNLGYIFEKGASWSVFLYVFGYLMIPDYVRVLFVC